ncbi:phosphopantetheine-binding protein [Gilvimarinus algae]|uniref:Phosphopantetheine-binding protein n=1 Tax=Gilvimarinus algae TaxID=3058037 RepID=A0ABT8TH82_9GAMM|nr:phosphopantetheine-binding protein [Gilvimarinus sp. SDUM040014]MDO3383452.1 phosphopantetheine-binding protein [Gilvimarinus sp. SDUM040014]
MHDSVTDDLKTALKQLIIEECDKDEFTPADIGDDDALLGGDLDLDSLDVLQICMAVKNQYGVRIEGNTAARRALKSINALAQTIVDSKAG